MRYLFSIIMFFACVTTQAKEIEVYYGAGLTFWYTVIDENAKTCSLSRHQAPPRPSFFLDRFIIPSEIKDGNDVYKVVEIGDHALSLLSVGDVSIPESVTSIGDFAFTSCKISSVTIPKSVRSIGEMAFATCPNLTSVTILDGVISIGKGAFWYSKSLRSVTIPNSVTSIGREAFDCCRSLTSITIPNSVTTIKWNTFHCCSGLRSVVIPNSVTTIEYNAFEECSSLTSVTIPNSVTSMWAQVFTKCSNLTTIYSLNPTPPNDLNGAFDSTHYQNATLYVPQEAVEAYRAAKGWKNFKNIQGIDITGIEKSISISQNTANITVGTTLQLSATVDGIDSPVLAWSSQNTAVATVANNGIVTGVGAGETDIVVTVEGHPELEAKCHVIVKESQISSDAYLKYSYSGNNATVTGLTSNAQSVIIIPEVTTYNNKEYTVTAITASAFSNSGTLEEITLPSTISTIPTGSFKNCKRLHTVHYGPKAASTTTAHWSNPVFEGCTALTTIDILGTVKTVSAYMFKTTPIEVISIPDNVEELGSDCFASCLKLKEIHIGKGVKKIAAAAFAVESGESAPATTLYYNAESLTSYTGLNGSYTSYMPFNRRNLVKIDFGRDVRSLPTYTFSECSYLTDIYCNGMTPPTLGSNCFNNTNKSTCRLHVVSGTKSLYQSAYIWKDFKNIVEDATAISNVIHDNEGIYSVYTLSGQKLNVDDIRQLPKGIYIINGKKVVIK